MRGTQKFKLRFPDMSFTQLNPPIPVHVIDKGKGQAFAVIDYGPEFDLLWVTGMDEGGEIWCVPNPAVRLQTNWSLGRSKSTRGGATVASITRANSSST